MKSLRLLFMQQYVALKQIAVPTVLVILVVSTALAVIYSTYKSRQLFSELQQKQRFEVDMEERWGRLLLEQSTWASHWRIEEVAMTKLGMKVPSSIDIKVIK